MTDKQGLVGGQYAVVRNFQIRKRGRAGNWPDFRGDVFTGVYGDDARRLQSLARVHAVDARMRVERAHKHDMQDVRQADIVNVMRETFDQARVFSALDSFSDVFISHDYALAFFAANSTASTMC